MSGGEILFLAHRIPFPPDRGDKIRSHHLLKALAELAPVHVACLGETDADMAAETDLEAVATSHCLVRRSKPLPIAGFAALATGKPVSLAAFHHAAIERFVRKTIEERPIAAIFVFSGQMGQYVPHDFAGRVVVDLCDVDSAKFEAYAAEKGGLRGWLDARENALLSAEEERLVHRASTTLLVSEAEAGLLQRRLRDASDANIRAMTNGIDAEYFDPAAVELHPDLSTGGLHVVFTGQMDYAPNVAACMRAARHIMPAIREAHAEAKFHIVGRAPTGELTALDGKNGVRVWGEVPDVRPFLNAADVVLAPLTIARGVQNKILEAMAMARPVLATPEAATGIDAIDGKHLMVRATDAELVSAALELLADPEQAAQFGNAARDFVIREKSWDAVFAPLAQMVGFEAAREARDAA